MYTWNLHYLSQNKLSETLSRMMLDDRKGDILIRIHTAIHTPQEAVGLAAHIKRLVPGAQIFGTSTSAVIYKGKLWPNQCVISITQMTQGSHVKCCRIPTFSAMEPLEPETLARQIKHNLLSEGSQFLLTFLTSRYQNVYRFVESCNEAFPGIIMTGGIANTPDISLIRFGEGGFVFDETGYSQEDLIAASIGGQTVECTASYATGAEPVGAPLQITDTFGKYVLGLDGKDAAATFREGIGRDPQTTQDLAGIFPYVYAEAAEIPIVMAYSAQESLDNAYPVHNAESRRFYDAHQGLDTAALREHIQANHTVLQGRQLRRAFLYDRKIVSDNRLLFRRIENFKKQEALFGYTCQARSMLYANCVKWELTPYEDTNLCGCITEGEIAYVDGRNVFANCCFVMAAIGEGPAMQRFNPYPFTFTENLAQDNERLMRYLGEMEQVPSSQTNASVKEFIAACEGKLLYSDIRGLPNASAMKMDMLLRGYDRICMVHIPETSMMETVFGKNMAELTRQQFALKCEAAGREHGYRVYAVEHWTMAIGTTSYLETLSAFSDHMRQLRRHLLDTMDGCIQVMPQACILDDCREDDLESMYRQAQREMSRRNVQFYVHRSQAGQTEEALFREKYRIINLLNYAVANDQVIPYYQGIRNNATGQISHYEALMRIRQEDGSLVSPGEFLDVAREFGTIYDALSGMMIRKVFRQFSALEDGIVSINLSVRDIENQELLRYIYGFLSTTAHPDHFIFEILENENIHNYDVIEKFIGRLHELGAKVSLDDFGSGYSNLQHVVNLDFDYLKIDGSIVRRCTTDKSCASVLSLISNWKKIGNKNIRIVAEFVENEHIQNILMEYDIDYSQGFLFSEPQPEIRMIL